MNVALASRVPVEFIGKARQLRDMVGAEDNILGEVTGELTDRLRARKKPIPRRETLTGVADEWQRRMPLRSRLAIEIDLNPRRKSLCIREMRATTSRYQPASWDTAEKGLIVGMTVLEVWPFHSRYDIHNLAHVGLHGLGRRFQRGLDDSEAAVMADLKALGEAALTLADRGEGAEFNVPVERGGAWVGVVELARDDRIGIDKVLAVRTFVAEGGWTRGGI